MKIKMFLRTPYVIPSEYGLETESIPMEFDLKEWVVMTHSGVPTFSFTLAIPGEPDLVCSVVRPTIYNIGAQYLVRKRSTKLIISDKEVINTLVEKGCAFHVDRITDGNRIYFDGGCSYFHTNATIGVTICEDETSVDRDIYGMVIKYINGDVVCALLLDPNKTVPVVLTYMNPTFESVNDKVVMKCKNTTITFKRAILKPDSYNNWTKGLVR